MQPIIVDKIQKNFGKNRAVNDVSFVVNSGEIFGLLGPNGAGKTTTIRIVLDIFKPDQGSVTILGGLMSEAKKNHIGYLPEERGLYQEMPLDRCLIYLATLKGLSSAESKARLTRYLERFELNPHRTKKVKELSKGMQQKAQLIATLIHEPEVIIIDEPFAALDPVNTQVVKDILDEERRKGRAIVMCTHQMHQVEALCSRIALINQGRTMLYGAVDQIKRDYAGNAVTVTGQGDFTEIPGVLETRAVNGDWHLSLAQGTSPQDVFRALAARDGLKLERFEIAEPSLDDIFIWVVQGQQEPRHG